jgi:hypothetical protein
MLPTASGSFILQAAAAAAVEKAANLNEVIKGLYDFYRKNHANSSVRTLLLACNCNAAKGHGTVHK